MRGVGLWVCFSLLPWLRLLGDSSRPAYSQGSKEPEPAYVPCSSGPESLNQIDGWERERRGVEIEYKGRSVSPETLAEMLIADCSDRLARMSAVNALHPSEASKAIVSLWQGNLEFMKWWLQNRRQKRNR